MRSTFFKRLATLSSVLSFSVLTACGGGGTSNEFVLPTAPPASAPTVTAPTIVLPSVLVMADSTFLGNYEDQAYSVVSKFIAEYGALATNGATRSSTTEYVRSSQATSLGARDVVLVMHAITDAVYLTEARYAENLNEIITVVKNSGKKPVFFASSPTVPGGLYSLEREETKRAAFELIKKNVAATRGIPYCPLTQTVWTLTDKPDGVHPFGAAVQGIVDDLKTCLARVNAV